MTIETPTDLRALVDEFDFGIKVDLGAGVQVVGVFNRDFDESIDVNGRRTTFRLVNEDAALIAIDQALTIPHDANAASPEVFTVRAKERGHRTTLLILETT